MKKNKRVINISKIKYVLLDLDNTIAYTDYNHFYSFNKALKEVLGITINLNFFLQLAGLSFDQKLKKVVKNKKINKKTIEKIRELKNKYYVENIKSIKLRPFFLRFLEYLNKKRICYGIVTTSTKIKVNAFLQSKKLKPNILITREDVKKSKPDKDPYIKALKKLKQKGIKKNEIVAVEDSINGVLSAKNAGLKVIAIYSKLNIKENQKRAFELADYKVKSFRELKNLF